MCVPNSDSRRRLACHPSWPFVGPASILGTCFLGLLFASGLVDNASAKSANSRADNGASNKAVSAKKEEPQPSAASVDLRPNFAQWNLPARAQGERPTCSVFTMAGALEYAIARRSGKSPRLSVEYLNWASNRAKRENGDGSNFEDLWKGFAWFGACPEEDMPYQPQFDPERRPSQAARQAAGLYRDGGYRLHWIKNWDASKGLSTAQLEQVKQTLRAGWPVCGGFLWPKQAKWTDGLLETPPRKDVEDGHSVLLVGFRDDPAQPGGGVVFIRNSGRDVRDGQMTYAYLLAYMNDAVWIDHLSIETRSVSEGEGRVGIRHTPRRP